MIARALLLLLLYVLLSGTASLKAQDVVRLHSLDNAGVLSPLVVGVIPSGRNNRYNEISAGSKEPVEDVYSAMEFAKAKVEASCFDGNTSPNGTAAHFARFRHSVLSLCGTTETLLVPALTAGGSQLLFAHDGFSSDAQGFGQHYGVNLLGNVNEKMFSQFLLPSLFKEDEKYEPMRGGQCWWRRYHNVIKHIVWSRPEGDQGKRVYNISLWLSPLLTAGLSNTYQPAAQRTLGNTAIRAGWGYAGAVGIDVFHEFQPDLWNALTFLDPFRWWCYKGSSRARKSSS